MTLLSEFGIKPTKIYVYLRVSTRSQVNQSDGLDTQNKICSEYIKNNFKGYMVEYFSEIGSSYNNKSNLPILNKIMRKLEPESLLLVRDISRLGRNTFQVFRLLQKIKKMNSHIIAINENMCYNYTRLMDRDFSHRIIDSERDSDKKYLFTIKRNNFIKKSGGYLGKAPWGTIKIKINEIPYIFKNPIEYLIIDLMKELYVKEKNIQSVVDYLNKNNILNRNGKLWKENTIKNILNKNFKNIFSTNKNTNINDEILTNKNYTNIPEIPKKFVDKYQFNKKIIIEHMKKIKL